MSQDIPALLEKLRKLGRGIDRLAAVGHAGKLVPILRRPGWLTAADTVYVHGMLDHLQVRLEELASAYEVFAAAAQELGAIPAEDVTLQDVSTAWAAGRASRSSQAPAGARALRFIR
jgi:hypothetical protein